jgi:hypothetical protein
MRRLILLLIGLLSLGLLQAPAHAQSFRPFAPQELESLVAPVALYPDAVVLNVLEAARYPGQVTEAARGAQDHAWHPSVKFLLAFPELIARMAESPQWMLDLGSASVGQWQELMSAVQVMRQRAYASGNLHSDERQLVVQDGPWLLVRPVQPQLIVVHYYNPLVVYGPAWRPRHRPVYWRPWVAPRPVIVRQRPALATNNVVVQQPIINAQSAAARAQAQSSEAYLARTRRLETQPSTAVARPSPTVTPYVNVPESRRQPAVQSHTAPRTEHRAQHHQQHPRHQHQQQQHRDRDNPSRAYKKPG